MFTLVHLNTPPPESMKIQVLQRVVDYLGDISPVSLTPSNPLYQLYQYVVGLEVHRYLDSMDGAQAGKPELIMALEADDPARLLGFALYLPYVDDPDACALVYLAVQASHRRQGIGRAMVEAMVARYPHAEVACVAGKVPYFEALDGNGTKEAPPPLGSTLHAGKNRVPGRLVPGQDPLVIVLEHLHLEVRLEQRHQLDETDGHHGVFVVPGLAFACRRFLDAQLQRLPLAMPDVAPGGAEAEQAIRVPGAVRDERVVVDPVLVDGVEAEEPARGQGAMHAGDAGLQSLDPGAVVDRIEEAGDQVERPIDAEAAHVLHGKLRFRAADGRLVQHGLVDVEPAAFIAGIDEVPHVRPGATGEIEVPGSGIAEQLLQPLDTAALGAIVDIGAHQIVVTRQVGIEGVAGHGDLEMFKCGVGGRAS